MSNKIATLIVEYDFLFIHYGVRNYILSLNKILLESYKTEFIAYKIIEGNYYWYQLFFNQYNIDDNLNPIILRNEKINEFNYSKFQKFLNDSKFQNAEYNLSIHFLSVGEFYSNSEFVLITNPWLITPNIRIIAKNIFGLVFDTIANEFTLTPNVTEDQLKWANRHLNGFNYFVNKCSKIFVISDHVKNNFIRAFPNSESKIKVIKPFLPINLHPFLNEEILECRENAIILAAPFDIRKGLLIIPNILNRLKSLDKIYIFGFPRCSIELFNNFFHDLKIKEIEYYPFINDFDLFTLYNKSKILLFPSEYEGLGFPIIEAQVFGCSVIVRNEEPMKSLNKNSLFVFKEVDDNLISKIENILFTSNLNNSFLIKEARKDFILPKSKIFLEEEL